MWEIPKKWKRILSEESLKDLEKESEDEKGEAEKLNMEENVADDTHKSETIVGDKKNVLLPEPTTPVKARKSKRGLMVSLSMMSIIILCIVVIVLYQDRDRKKGENEASATSGVEKRVGTPKENVPATNSLEICSKFDRQLWQFENCNPDNIRRLVGTACDRLWVLQVASLRDEKKAKELQNWIEKRCVGERRRVVYVDILTRNSDIFYCVRIGVFESRNEAESYNDYIRGCFLKFDRTLGESFATSFKEGCARVISAGQANAVGLFLNRQKEYKCAVGCFARAYELEPNNAQYIDDIGYTFMLDRNYEMCYKCSAKALRIAEVHGEGGVAGSANRNIGKCLAELARLEENSCRRILMKKACKHYEDSLKLREDMGFRKAYKVTKNEYERYCR